MGEFKSLYICSLFLVIHFLLGNNIVVQNCRLFFFVFQRKLRNGYYTQSPIIRTGPIRLGAEFWGKFKTRALGSSNLRTTSKNLRTASPQIFKAKNQFVDESIVDGPQKKIKKSKSYCSAQLQFR